MNPSLHLDADTLRDHGAIKVLRSVERIFSGLRPSQGPCASNFSYFIASGRGLSQKSSLTRYMGYVRNICIQDMDKIYKCVGNGPERSRPGLSYCHDQCSAYLFPSKKRCLLKSQMALKVGDTDLEYSARVWVFGQNAVPLRSSHPLGN